MGGTPIRTKIMQHFHSHPGVLTFVSDIMESAGETDSMRVMNGVSTILRDGALPGLERVQKGGPWIYKPNSVPNKPERERTLFELVGRSKSGTLILEGEDGNLYRATELE